MITIANFSTNQKLSRQRNGTCEFTIGEKDAVSDTMDESKYF